MGHQHRRRPEPDPDFDVAVLGHLRGLQRVCHSAERASKFSAIECSQHLRFLLVDSGRLQQYRRSHGMRGLPQLRAFDIESNLPRGASHITISSGVGGVIGWGDEFASLWTAGAPLPVDQFPPGRMPPFVDLSLDRFLDSTVLVLDSVRIRRRVLIKFFANKMGADHYDPEDKVRSKDTPAIQQELRQFVAIRDALDRFMVSGNDQGSLRLIYMEMIGIGLQLLNSPQVRPILNLPP